VAHKLIEPENQRNGDVARRSVGIRRLPGSPILRLVFTPGSPIQPFSDSKYLLEEPTPMETPIPLPVLGAQSAALISASALFPNIG